jgi:DNA-binding transcriptional ArsR family regulator
MPSQHLDATFQALADPTRRAIVARLSSGGSASVSDLATPFDMSLPGVMKHVGVLEAAGLIEREKIGRTVFCRLNTAPMSEATNWLQDMATFWSSRLDALSEHVEQRNRPRAKSQASANYNRDKESKQ